MPEAILARLRAKRNSVVIPEKLGTAKPNSGWVDEGALTGKQAKRNYMAILELTKEAEKARAAKDLGESNRLQALIKNCEDEFILLVYEELDLWQRYWGNPVVYGNWQVALAPQTKIKWEGRPKI